MTAFNQLPLYLRIAIVGIAVILLGVLAQLLGVDIPGLPGGGDPSPAPSVTPSPSELNPSPSPTMLPPAPTTQP